MFVAYTLLDEAKEPNKRGNPIIASFVAMWGRLELLKELRQLGKRVLYYDTDSIIFTHKRGEYAPKLGTMLGQWTDEIKEKYGPCVMIAEFVASGPKSYDLRLTNCQEIVKIRGFTITLFNKNSVNFKAIYNCVNEGLGRVITE